MSMNLDEFRVLEKIKISYLRNRGQVLAISKELNLDLAYIKKMVAKFKKRDSRDTKFLIADTLIQHIMTGHHQRITHLDEMLRSLDKMEQPLLSICCSNPVRPYPDDDPLYAGRYECLFHHAPCETQRVNMLSIYRLKIQLLKQLGDEEVRLVDMAVKMGYVGSEPQPPGPIVKAQQNILVMPGKDGQSVIQDYSQLSPMDRDRLIDNLTKQIIPSKQSNVEGINDEQPGEGTVPRNESEQA